MKDKSTPTRLSQREVISVMILEEIDALVEKVETLNKTIDQTETKFNTMINKLEQAGDKYHQSVLIANARLKNEIIEHLKTVSATTIEKRRMDSVSDNRQVPFLNILMVSCLIAALIFIFSLINHLL